MRPPSVRALAVVTLAMTVAACSGDGGTGAARSTTTAATAPPGAPPVVTVQGGPAVVGVDGDITPVHDPAVVREGDTYHLFSTGPWIEHRTSTDLVDWALEGSVFDGPPAWVTEELDHTPDNLWAPDVSWWGGTWHLYYSASKWVPGQMPTRNSVIAHATSPTLDPDDPDYGWVDHGPVVQSRGEFADPDRSGFNAIDPHVVLDGDQPWLTWGSGFDGLFLQRLDDDGTLDESMEPMNLARRASHPVLVIEAPWIIRRGDWWYLFASYDLCCAGTRSNYNVRVGRARELTGPYEDRDGRLLTEGGGTKVLTAHGEVVGPGHQALLELGDDNWWLVHHWYDAAHDGRPTLGIRPLDWDDDGWPVARGWSPDLAPAEPMGGRP